MTNNQVNMGDGLAPRMIYYDGMYEAALGRAYSTRSNLVNHGFSMPKITPSYFMLHLIIKLV